MVGLAKGPAFLVVAFHISEFFQVRATLKDTITVDIG